MPIIARQCVRSSKRKRKCISGTEFVSTTIGLFVTALTAITEGEVPKVAVAMASCACLPGGTAEEELGCCDPG